MLFLCLSSQFKLPDVFKMSAFRIVVHATDQWMRQKIVRCSMLCETFFFINEAWTVIRNFQTTTEDFFVQRPQCIETLTIRITCAI